MANKVTTTDTTNKVVITPQSSKKLTIDSGNGNNLTLNQSTPNNVQITNNDVDTSLTPNNVSISPTDNNISLSSTSTPVTVNQSSTSIVTVNTVGPQGPKGDSGTDGNVLVSNELEDLRLFTGSIQTEVDSLTAATSSYLTSVPNGTISSSAQITINESQISDLSHTDISALNIFTGSIQTEVDNLTTSTSSYALAANISGAFTEPSGGFSTRITTLETAGYITESTDISALNTFTGSIQTEVDSLTTATSSYLTESTDISALNTFTGSIQTEVNTLTAATSSYLTELPENASFTQLTSSVFRVGFLDRNLVMFGGSSLLSTNPSIFSLGSNIIDFNTGINITSTYKLSFDNDITNTYIAANSETPEDLEIHADQDILLKADGQVIVDNGLTATSLTGSISASSIENFNTEVSKSAAAAGFGTGGTPTDISALNTFTGSIQTEVNNLTAVTGSYALTSSISGAFAEPSGGFSTRITTLEGSNFTPSLSTDIEARNITASGNISSSGNITASNIQVANDIELSPQSKIFVGTNTTEIATNGDDYWIIKANGIRVADFKSNGVVFNESSSPVADFRIESDTKSHIFFVDSSANKISIGTDTVSDSLLTIEGDISASGDIIASSFTGSIATSSITGFNTEVSRSAAAAGFGTGGGGGFTPSLSTDIEARNITASGNISSSGNLITNNIISNNIRNNNLTLTRVVFAGTQGALVDNSNFLFINDTLYTPKILTSAHITASGNISASGNIIGNNITVDSNLTVGSDVSLGVGSTVYNSNDNPLIDILSTKFILGNFLYPLQILSNITASGNISSSNIIYAKTGSFSHLEGNSPITVKDTITFQGAITASNISASGDIFGSSLVLEGGTFTSSSLAASISDITDISALNTFTSSIQTEVNTLIAATSSYLTESVDISSLNTFTGSIQTEVNNLTSATSSYLTELPNGLISESAQFTTSDNFNVGDITSSALFINPSTGPAEIILDAFTSNYASQIKFSALNVDKWILGMDSVNPQDFRILKGSTLNNVNGIYITGSTGYVGLGSLTPYERLTVVGNISASGIVYGLTGSFSHLEGNSPITVKDVITFKNNATFAGSKLTTADIDITGGSFKLGGGIFTSSSLAAAVGGGGDNLGNHTAEIDLNMATHDITNAGSITAVSLTGSISTSSIEGFNNSVSNLAQNVFDARDQEAIDALNLFTGSIQIEVDNLTSVTSSYALTSSISGAFAEPSGGFSTRVTTLETNNTGTNTGDQDLSTYALIANISGAFTAPSGGFSTRITTLETAGYLTDPITTSSITDFNTEVSRSAAAAGFGTEGEGGFTPSLSTDIEARNITASNDISSSGVLRISKVILPQNGQVEYNNSNYFRFGVTNVSIKTSIANYDINSRINFFGGANVGINPPTNSTIAPEKLTVGGNISASGNFIGDGLILAGGNGVFTSASLAAAQAGSDDLGNHTASLNLNMSTFDITNAGSITAVSLTGSIATSSIENFSTEVSRSAAAAGFGTGGEGGFTPSLSTDIEARNITASIISASGNLSGNGLILAGGNGIFTSASLAAAIAGGDNLGNHTASLDLNMGGNAIINVSNVDGINVSTLKSDFDTLEGKTLISSSAQVDHDLTTNFSADEHFTQASITTVGTVTSGDVSAILPTGTVSGSSQIDLGLATGTAANATNALTASYVAGSNVDGTVGSAILAGSAVNAANVTITNVSNDDEYGFVFRTGTGSPTGLYGDSQVDTPSWNPSTNTIKTPIISASSALYVNGTINATSITASIATSSITNFPTEVSRSAAAAGFGTGGEGGFTPSLSTNITALNITASANISASGNLLGNGLILAGGNGVFTSASLAAAQAGGDDLGNHTATTDLNLSGNSIHAALNITASANISASGNIIGNTGSFDHIEIDNFVNNGTGVPTISSATNLVLSASGAVVIKDLIQLNGTDTGSISGPINGSIIYDNLQHKFFGYANGNWVAFN